MPLYPYRCTQCGHRFEKIQSFKSKPLTRCSECGGTLERLLTAPGLQFKGAGWYVTDYASKGGSSSESAPAEAGKADIKAGAEAKTESKTESTKTTGGDSKAGSPAPSTSAAPASGSSKT